MQRRGVALPVAEKLIGFEPERGGCFAGLCCGGKAGAAKRGGVSTPEEEWCRPVTVTEAGRVYAGGGG